MIKFIVPIYVGIEIEEPFTTDKDFVIELSRDKALNIVKHISMGIPGSSVGIPKTISEIEVDFFINETKQ